MPWRCTSLCPLRCRCGPPATPQALPRLAPSARRQSLRPRHRARCRRWRGPSVPRWRASSPAWHPSCPVGRARRARALRTLVSRASRAWGGGGGVPLVGPGPRTWVVAWRRRLPGCGPGSCRMLDAARARCITGGAGVHPQHRGTQALVPEPEQSLPPPPRPAVEPLQAPAGARPSTGRRTRCCASGRTTGSHAPLLYAHACPAVCVHACLATGQPPQGGPSRRGLVAPCIRGAA